MVDLTPYKKSIEEIRQNKPSQYQGDPRLGFYNELVSAGYKPSSAIELGRVIRIADPEDKGKKKTGWYYYVEVTDSQNEGQCIGIGSYGSWRAADKITWVSRDFNHMSTSERLNYHAELEKLREQKELEQQKIYAEAAKEAYDEYANAEQASKSHEYVKNKKIKNLTNVRQLDKALLIPVLNEAKEIISLQRIYGNGFKSFLTGGRTKGGYFIIEGDASKPVYIAEGYSTADAVNQATGGTVYICFNCNNLYEIVSIAKKHNANSKIIIAADDDTQTKDNPGRTKATQAAEGLSVDVVFPDTQYGSDFNDWLCNTSVKELEKFFQLSDVKPYKKKDKQNADNVQQPHKGILTDVYDYYNTTSGNKQHGFAMQTAIGFASIILGRAFKTNLENYASLFLLNIGKSGTGKEHAKTVIETLLDGTGNGNFISGDGYSSSGAVFSQLLLKPKHITIIDEFGRHLESSANIKGGDHHKREANTKLMEAIGRCHSIMRPQSYSTMTLKKQDAEAVQNRVIHNPAITLLGMSTPATLFKTLGTGAIKDGFVNRFIISISDAQRSIRIHKPIIDVPESIIEWVSKVQSRVRFEHIASEEAQPVVLQFTSDALQLQEDFQWHCVNIANEMEAFGMEEISGRSNEMAMRLSLIAALSRDPMAEYIEAEDMGWSIEYVKACLEKTIDKLKMTISSSDYEAHKKEFLQALRDAGGWVMRTNMIKQSPYSAHPRKYIDEILTDLVDAGLIEERQAETGKRGRPSKEYLAIE